MKVKFVVNANYDFGGDEIGQFDNMKQATVAVGNYINEAEIDNDAYTIEGITMMPRANDTEIPTLGADWLFDGWSNEPTRQEVADEFGTY